MPYVPSEKTNPPAEDRKILDATVEPLARKVANEITSNLSIIKIYKRTFLNVARALNLILLNERADALMSKVTLLIFRQLWKNPEPEELNLARAIYEVGAKYGYEGAFLGELNYPFTRFIQRVPQIMVTQGKWKEELRYWLYAATVEGLTWTASKTKNWGIGISGVFEDIKDEYKWRVNRSYEAAQIIKSGDCYDTPFYGRLIEVIDEESGKLIGYMEPWLKRSEETLHQDVLDWQIVVKKKK